MPIKVTRNYELFTFTELLEREKKKEGPPRAAEAAQQWLQEAQTDGQWWDCVYAMWQDALEQIGFTDPEISFSGFWSQGDGASFTAGVDLEKMIRFLADPGDPVDSIRGLDDGGEDFTNWVRFKYPTGRPEYLALLEHLDDLRLKVVRGLLRYVHECSCSVDMEYCGEEEHEALAEKLVEDVEALRETLSQCIYRDLEREYDAITEDEALEEFADINGYTFNGNGKFEEE